MHLGSCNCWGPLLWHETSLKTFEKLTFLDVCDENARSELPSTSEENMDASDASRPTFSYNWPTTSNTSEYDKELESSWLNLPLVVCACLLSVVTIVGNALVMAAVATTSRLRTLSNRFLCSLAFADFLIGSTIMPATIVKMLNGGAWTLGVIPCYLWISLDVFLSTASIVSVCVISIDRCLSVTRPLSYRHGARTRRLVDLMIGLAWLFAATLAAPPLLVSLPRVRDSLGERADCSLSMEPAYVVISSMGSFFVPTFMMLCMYTCIFCTITGRHDDNAMLANGRSLASRSLYLRARLDRRSVDEHVNLRVHRRISERAREEAKTSRTLSIVVGVLIICWLPFFTLYLIAPFSSFERSDVWMSAFTWLGWSNSAMNPAIYTLCSADFRATFRRWICRWCFRLNRRRPNKMEFRGSSSLTVVNRHIIRL